MSRFESLPPNIHQKIITCFMPNLPTINHDVDRFEKEAHKLIWKFTAYNLAASCRTMQQATQQFMQQKWSDAKRDFKDVEWSSPSYEVISWRIVVLLGAWQKTKALRLKAAAAVQDKDNIWAKPFVSPVIKKQLKSAPFKPLILVKTSAYIPPLSTKNEPQVKSEPADSVVVEATVKKEVVIKSEVDEEIRSSPIIDKFNAMSTVSPKKESSPLKRKIKLESEVGNNPAFKMETRAIKRTKK